MSKQIKAEASSSLDWYFVGKVVIVVVFMAGAFFLVKNLYTSAQEKALEQQKDLVLEVKEVLNRVQEVVQTNKGVLSGAYGFLRKNGN